MLRCAVTDSKHFGNRLAERVSGLQAQAQRLAADGVDYIQLREKDLDAGALLYTAERLSAVLRQQGNRTRLLINSRADVAVAAAASGVHLTSRADELTPQQVRGIFAVAAVGLEPIVSVSCHTIAEVARARAEGATLLLFGPVFEKRVGNERVADGAGLATLREACNAAGNIPVLALGGITDDNLASCLVSGAAGIAGIRIFQ